MSMLSSYKFYFRLAGSMFATYEFKRSINGKTEIKKNTTRKSINNHKNCSNYSHGNWSKKRR